MELTSRNISSLKSTVCRRGWCREIELMHAPTDGRISILDESVIGTFGLGSHWERSQGERVPTHPDHSGRKSYTQLLPRTLCTLLAWPNLLLWLCAGVTTSGCGYHGDGLACLRFRCDTINTKLSSPSGRRNPHTHTGAPYAAARFRAV